MAQMLQPERVLVMVFVNLIPRIPEGVRLSVRKRTTSMFTHVSEPEGRRAWHAAYYLIVYEFLSLAVN